MYAQKVEICGVNTAKLKTLTGEETARLLEKAHAGDMAAREELISGNLRLVLSILQRFGGRGENMDDLFQIGCVGLIKAIDRFDLGQDVRFSTYGVPMIIGEIRRYLRDNSTIRVSRSMRDLAYRAMQKREELTRASGKEPSSDELAAALGVKASEIAEALEAIAQPVSFFDPIYAEGGDSIYVMDQLSDPDNTDENWLEDIALKEAMTHLSPREKKIIAMRYYKGKTQMEIASEIGISQAQVSRIEKGALDRIKKGM